VPAVFSKTSETARYVQEKNTTAQYCLSCKCFRLSSKSLWLYAVISPNLYSDTQMLFSFTKCLKILAQPKVVSQYKLAEPQKGKSADSQFRTSPRTFAARIFFRAKIPLISSKVDVNNCHVKQEMCSVLLLS
jgi:hypothetical protein